MTSFAVFAPGESPLGAVIPADTPHAVSVSLPTWADTVSYEEGEERIKVAVKSGYPRFVIHHLITQLAQIAIRRYGNAEEDCIVLSTKHAAEDCAKFINTRNSEAKARTCRFEVTSEVSENESNQNRRVLVVHVCFFDKQDFAFAKQFWQHTGTGVSSRFAERCLILLGAIDPEAAEQAERAEAKTQARLKSQRYTANSHKPKGISGINKLSRYSTAKDTPTLPQLDLNGAVDQDEDVLSRYVEERYGRNLDLSLAPLAKMALRRRIAGVLREAPGKAISVEKIEDSKNDESTRGVAALSEHDVSLYGTGMSAIWHAHQLIMAARQSEGKELGKSICFGFPYTDTLKILEKWGPGCHFLGHGLNSDLSELRELAQIASPPLLAVFCEFPSNPLLRSPPLAEIRKLADEFGFLVVIDETIAGFVNVETVPYSDITVSSLTKVFSGECNVMGGSLVLNPEAPFYQLLKRTQASNYDDEYFEEDAIYLERNSRDFRERVAHMNYTAETVCDFLRERRADGPLPEGMIPPSVVNGENRRVIKEVFYPKYMTPENYKACMPEPNPDFGPHATGFGPLFSITFISKEAAQAFFDALDCYKGPSLGTNFTISCVYTLLAHYGELEWASTWGVETNLVRISVGLEDTGLVLGWMKKSLEAAEKTVTAL